MAFQPAVKYLKNTNIYAQKINTEEKNYENLRGTLHVVTLVLYNYICTIYLNLSILYFVSLSSHLSIFVACIILIFSVYNTYMLCNNNSLWLFKSKTIL